MSKLYRTPHPYSRSLISLLSDWAQARFRPFCQRASFPHRLFFLFTSMSLGCLVSHGAWSCSFGSRLTLKELWGITDYVFQLNVREAYYALYSMEDFTLLQWEIKCSDVEYRVKYLKQGHLWSHSNFRKDSRSCATIFWDLNTWDKNGKIFCTNSDRFLRHKTLKRFFVFLLEGDLKCH